MMIQIFFIISLVSSISCTTVQDFCVADLKSPQSATGYSCKDPNQVTVDDFILTAFRRPGNTKNPNKATVTPGFAPTYAGINALGVSVARADLAPGGVIPLHTHPGASEIVSVVQGTIRAGFISSSNKVYVKTLEAGDSIAFPQGLLHFLLNAGKGPAMAIFSFGSSSPTTQLLPLTLFKNDLPTDVVTATTSLSAAEVKRLKGALGGTN